MPTTAPPPSADDREVALQPASPPPAAPPSSASDPRAAPPPSATSIWSCLSSLAVYAVLLLLCRGATFEESRASEAVAVCLVLSWLPMLLVDLALLRVHRRPSTGLDFDRPRRPVDLGRVGLKLLGLAGTLGACALLYCLFPEYQSSYYAPFFHVAPAAAGLALVAAVPYLLILDGRMVEPEDEYVQMGRLLLGRFRGVRWPALGRHALAWLVKAFFLPLMFVFTVDNFTWVLTCSPDATFAGVFDLSYELLLTVDLFYAASGYVLTLRLIDAHVRSTEPTLVGWAVALACYPPFWGWLRLGYLNYDDGDAWGSLLGAHPTAYVLWGSLILVLHFIYSASTVYFGCRFSNLTHRGLLARGPYRWSKHPAYLAKNLSWWLIAVPFFSREGVWAALRHSLRLLGLNLVYYGRARTEERHLSADPEYVAYARWIDEHGALAGLGRWIPALRFRGPDRGPHP